ncbi:4Fe-4S cluster-binding domain-containing protein [Acetanaerobacterium elongatum]|uniref:Putative pyruvate formate lyase activating enzyme n=1 Tax=Acetanaerobacterium elongatum TaxID=258515 RepID=A0A1H0EPW5_9FIRM|nr:4Fe-4S cluster-binding domain-containing protein [Acetanaerobacterium elongatum]SDN84359.1 putative pyruvate formate lyase activating enzyme [Acetanaerobacterium elongatum]
MAERCTVCPRRCGALRESAATLGVCKMVDNPVVARAGVHLWEEPPISGTKGSGTVFFSGCSLGCVFCQNHAISHENYGKEITVARLREIYFELIAQGVHNINLVNPTHFTRAIAQSLTQPLPVPVVYNSSGYERVESLRLLEGKIQVYLPDMKYVDSAVSERYSRAPDYFEYASKAIREMYRQTGDYVLDENGLLKSGVLIRHLILPGNTRNTLAVINWVRATFPPGSVLFSLMSQYTPCGELSGCPEINRRITMREYEKVQNYLFESGIEDGFLQERCAAKKDYIPCFDLSGV